MAPFLDAIISIQHQKPIEDYNRKLRDYVPLEHKLFLEKVEKWTPLRELVQQYSNADFIEQYNNFIGEFVEFRSKHIQVYIKYGPIPVALNKHIRDGHFIHCHASLKEKGRDACRPGPRQQYDW